MFSEISTRSWENQLHLVRKSWHCLSSTLLLGIVLTTASLRAPDQRGTRWFHWALWRVTCCLWMDGFSDPKLSEKLKLILFPKNSFRNARHLSGWKQTWCLCAKQVCAGFVLLTRPPLITAFVQKGALQLWFSKGLYKESPWPCMAPGRAQWTALWVWVRHVLLCSLPLWDTRHLI